MDQPYPPALYPLLETGSNYDSPFKAKMKVFCCIKVIARQTGGIFRFSEAGSFFH
jgi:hypothetical protein